MSSCNCKCKDRAFNVKWCDKNESQDDIKRAGDIVKDSELCDIVSNTEKGIFLLWCRIREIIITICDIFKRMARLQKKIQYICGVQHCLNQSLTDVVEKPKSDSTVNASIIRRYKNKSPNNPSDAQSVYDEALAIYNEQIQRLDRAKKRLEAIKADSSTSDNDGILMSGYLDDSRRGSFDYYSKLIIATTKTGVNYPVGGITFGNNKNVDFTRGDIRQGASTLLRNVGVTSDGRNINMRVIFKEFFLSSHATTRGAFGEKEWLTVKNIGGSITISVGNFYRVTGSFEFLDDDNSPINLMAVSVVNDIDYKQGFNVLFNNSQTFYKRPPGSGIVVKGKYVGASESYNADDDKSIPKGSLLFVGVGSKVDWDILANDPGVTYIDGDSNSDSSWSISFFGNDFRGEIVDLHEPPKPVQPEPPKEPCGLMDCNFDCLGDN